MDLPKNDPSTLPREERSNQPSAGFLKPFNSMANSQ